MRWLSFYRNQKLTFGYITSDGSGVVDVGERSDFSDLRQVLESTDLATLAGKCGDSADLSLEDVEYAPTITNPKKILCVGLNYKAHQEETGRGGEGFPYEVNEQIEWLSSESSKALGLDIAGVDLLFH